MVVYVTNEEPTAKDIYFDDLKVTYTPTIIAQTDSYYPFGLSQGNMSYVREGRGKNQFLYNGKELVEGFELGWYDYGARYYAPDLGRWHAVDPLAEKMTTWSPYVFSYNNPIRFVDPDGKKPGDVSVKRVRRFNKTDTDGNYNINSIHDLGHTGVRGFQRNAEGSTEVVLDIAYNYKFVDGPYQQNNPNSQLNKDNPGLFEEVQAHEESHADQYEEILKTSEDYTYGDNTGTIIEVFDKSLSDITESHEKLMKNAKSEKEAVAIKKSFDQSVNGLVASLSKQTFVKVQQKYGGSQNTENDANRKAAIKLQSKGINPKYINNRSKVKYEGKELD